MKTEQLELSQLNNIVIGDEKLKKQIEQFNQIRFENVLMTPENALEYLERNPDNNRKLNKHNVNRYKQDMLTGKWIPGPGSIISIDLNGKIQNGQHRLHAIAESGIAIPMIIMSNLPVEGVYVVDTGKNRSVGEALTIAGFKKDTTTQGGIAKILLNLSVGKNSAAVNNQFKTSFLTIPEIIDFISKNETLINNAVDKSLWCREENKFLPATLIGAYYIIFSSIDKNKADEFLEKFRTGAGLEENNPILTLRNKFQRDLKSTHKMTPASKISLLITSWNMFIQGKSGSFNVRKDYIKVENEEGKQVQDNILKKLV